MKISVVKNILDANNRIAQENRQLFDSKCTYVVNLMSSPGAGKTTIVERTIEKLKDRYRIAVIEGDIQDTCDADRISRHNIPVVQINTQGACHIDGNMVRETLPQFDLDTIDVIINENVGNLVCPAEFNIGENIKAMILSVPEGDDKPSKYPLIFQQSAVMLINKTDLLPYVDFDMEKVRADVRVLNSDIGILPVSAKTGEGLDDWCSWLSDRIDAFFAAMK